MSVINQPFQGQLGDILIQELDKDYSACTIFSAFAKNSGVLRLKESLDNFRKKGGTVTAFIGIDLDGTSYEALLNLYKLCDNLYVIHSENFSTTFHSKIYLLEQTDKAWCAIGSNNLTGGGLWTNFESCHIETYLLPEEMPKIDNIHAVMDKYMDEDYGCSAKISNIKDIDVLLEADYVHNEISQKVTATSRRVSEKKKRKKITLFGSENVSVPDIIIEGQDQRNLLLSAEDKHKGDLTILPDSKVQPAFTNEQFWFEMRESTGGSRNILDLSKQGKIVTGSVVGTPYEYPQDSSRMYGGVKFFDIEPEDTDCIKDIYINFQGKDYYPSTIKFASNNGSWRIQLKGSPQPNDGTDELSKFGLRGEFVHKILVFEKINTKYYVLSILDEKELPNVKSISRVWARNGSNSNSKAYGML